MIPCPACSAPVPEGSRFCPSCAAPLPATPDDPTQTSVPTSAPSAPVSHPSLNRGRFLPGAMLADRYRIIGLLAVCVGTFLFELSNVLPMTLDFSLWYSGGFFVLLLITAALLAYGFRFSLAGRSMFADGALDG
jgi:hypothetical protein